MAKPKDKIRMKKAGKEIGLKENQKDMELMSLQSANKTSSMGLKPTLKVIKIPIIRY